MTFTPDPRSSDPVHPDVPRPALAAYRERTAALSLLERRLQRQHLTLGYLRLALGIAVVIFLLPPRWYALLPLAGFVVAARVHQRRLDHLAETRRALRFYELGIARQEDRWSGMQPRQTRLDTSKSLYAADLDLFGAGSLFELLCEARTTLGEDTLAQWLLAPATVAEVKERQQAVADLRDRLALREAFAAAKGAAVAAVEPEPLAAWGEAQTATLPSALRWVSPVLVVLFFAGIWRYALAHTPLLLILVLLVNAALTFGYQRIFKELFAQAERSSRSLQTVAALLRLVEAENFTVPRLQKLQAGLRDAATPASQALSRLASLVQWGEARSNYVVRILDTALLYSLQIGIALGRWRSQFGGQIASWLRVLGEFEALLSLAGYSFEHPLDPLPGFDEGEPAFEATALGHPLLPRSQCVRNDLALSHGTQLLLVSGSNMSGKSTLMRSVGVNAVLAMAGAPVRAGRLAMTPLTVAASIQVSDSLQAGRSRFYAEILRLRAIVEAARTQAPVLFLIDEVLAGTNSSDRLAGARGLVEDLLQSGAVGLLSTHDLALTSLRTGDLETVKNVHFEDQVIDGQLRFDYKLRDGVVERSNGLALMRLIGLKV